MREKTPNKKKKTKKEEWVHARVTHLECNNPATKPILQPSRPRLALLKAERMPIQFYRYLFEQVGKKQHWYSRRVMSDDEVYSIIHASTTHIHVLYADGSPAGFFELDASNLPDSVEIVFFGLTTSFQGLGLGKWFLSAAISNAWNLKPQKLILQTNTLDHPAALRLYQSQGFSPVGISEEKLTYWE
ncbi:MAG: GNAT family N-acetyltransferase [Nitratireductor sp.]